MAALTENPEKTITDEIERFVSESPGNRQSKIDGSPYFETPLVGYADAHDPLFKEIKKSIGDFYLTPIEILKQSFPEHNTAWVGASVISWVLPIYKSIRKSNRKESRHPSRAWAYTRTYGEEFNNMLRSHIAAFINDRGFPTAAPSLMPLFSVCPTETVGFTSNWSERHAAYVAGLGTFSLSRGLITRKGIAMRCGSVVTGLKLTPTPRVYQDYRQNCLFYNSGTCGKCIARCPAGAISKDGHNKDICMAHLMEIMVMADSYDAAIPGCGLCQTAVPCEAEIPVKVE